MNTERNFERGSARIGFIVPVSNSNLEPDMVAMKPAGSSVHFMRAGGYDLEKIPDSGQMQQFARASLQSVLEALSAVRPDSIAYGCTSATFSLGPDYDRKFTADMTSQTEVPCLTAAGALVETLNDLDIQKASFASPYTEELSREGANFLSASGIDIVETTYIGSDLGNYGQSELTPDEVYQLGLKADRPGAEAVVLSCTDMRAAEIIDVLESEIGKPVVSSNQALMYVSCKRLRLISNIPGRLSTLPNY